MLTSVRRLTLAVAAVGMVFAMGACGKDEDRVEVSRNETVPVEFAIELRGDVNATYKGTAESNFVVQRTKSKDRDVQAAQVVGVEPVEPLLSQDMLFRAGVGVVNFDGDGAYTIPVGSPYDLIANAARTARPDPQSSIKVEWWPTKDAAGDPQLFMRRAKPCKVVIHDDGTRGSLTCPDVTNETRDKHLSLSLRWTAPREPQATTTTGP